MKPINYDEYHPIVQQYGRLFEWVCVGKDKLGRPIYMTGKYKCV